MKGYAAHEEGVYKDIADARSRLLAARSPEETIQAANQQTGALGRLLAIAEVDHSEEEPTQEVGVVLPAHEKACPRSGAPRHRPG